MKSSSSSSSCRAISTDISNLLSSPFPIVHCFRQLFRNTSRIGTELLYVGSSWSSCLWSSMWRGPQEEGKRGETMGRRNLPPLLQYFSEARTVGVTSNWSRVWSFQEKLGTRLVYKQMYQHLFRIGFCDEQQPSNSSYFAAIFLLSFQSSKRL